MRKPFVVWTWIVAAVVLAPGGFAATAEKDSAGAASPVPRKSGVPNLQGECVYQCATDADCSSGKVCMDTACGGQICDKPCDNCKSDADCGLLYECVTYRCGKKCTLACPDGATTAAKINDLFTKLTPTLNQLWPTIAKNEGLDPMESVFAGDIDLKCKNGGDELCAKGAGVCKKFYAHVKVTDLKGLSKVQFSNLSVTGLSTFEGSHACEYGKDPYSGDFLCSYEGTGSGKASLASDQWLTASIPVIEIKTRCTYFYGTNTAVVWSGSAECRARMPAGSGEFGWCGGSCASGDPAEVIAYGEMTKLKLSVDDFSCDVKGDLTGDASVIAWVTEALVPELKNEIAKALEGPLKGALNDLFEDVVPYPGECKEPSEQASVESPPHEGPAD